MSIKRKITSFSRKSHRFLAPLAGIVLFLLSVTGFVDISVKELFNVKKADRKWLMDIHQGRIGSDMTRVPFTIFTALLVCYMSLSGFFLVRKGFWTLKFYSRKTWRSTARQLHQKFSSFMLIWLAVVAITGAVYRTLRTGFGVEKKYVTWLLWFHCGNFNVYFQFIYTTLLTIGTLILVITGVVMHYRYLKKEITQKFFKKKKETYHDLELNTSEAFMTQDGIVQEIVQEDEVVLQGVKVENVTEEIIK